MKEGLMSPVENYFGLLPDELLLYILKFSATDEEGFSNLKLVDKRFYASINILLNQIKERGYFLKEKNILKGFADRVPDFLILIRNCNYRDIFSELDQEARKAEAGLKIEKLKCEQATQNPIILMQLAELYYFVGEYKEARSVAIQAFDAGCFTARYLRYAALYRLEEAGNGLADDSASVYYEELWNKYTNHRGLKPNYRIHGVPVFPVGVAEALVLNEVKINEVLAKIMFRLEVSHTNLSPVPPAISFHSLAVLLNGKKADTFIGCFNRLFASSGAFYRDQLKLVDDLNQVQVVDANHVSKRTALAWLCDADVSCYDEYFTACKYTVTFVKDIDAQKNLLELIPSAAFKDVLEKIAANKLSKDKLRRVEKLMGILAAASANAEKLINDEKLKAFILKQLNSLYSLRSGNIPDHLRGNFFNFVLNRINAIENSQKSSKKRDIAKEKGAFLQLFSANILEEFSEEHLKLLNDYFDLMKYYGYNEASVVKFPRKLAKVFYQFLENCPAAKNLDKNIIISLFKIDLSNIEMLERLVLLPELKNIANVEELRSLEFRANRNNNFIFTRTVSNVVPMVQMLPHAIWANNSASGNPPLEDEQNKRKQPEGEVSMPDTKCRKR